MNSVGAPGGFDTVNVRDGDQVAFGIRDSRLQKGIVDTRHPSPHAQVDLLPAPGSDVADARARDPWSLIAAQIGLCGRARNRGECQRKELIFHARRRTYMQGYVLRSDRLKAAMQ